MKWLLQIATLLLLISVTGACYKSPSGETGIEKQASSATPSRTGLVDINSASKAELAALPGIGEAYAQHIIDNRPYREKTDLVRRNVIPEATYEKVRERVIAKQH